ncbi:MAG TPA: hypothetical protein VIB38_15410 [Aestuariivirgaceae bacterium]
MVALALRRLLAVMLTIGEAVQNLIFRSGLGSRRPPLTAQRKKPMSTETAESALRHVLSIARGCGAKLFLISGTLLGFYRGGGLLRHDKDIDLGVLWDDPRLPDLLTALGKADRLRLHETVRLGRIDALMNPAIPPLYADAMTLKYDYLAEGARPVRIDLFVHFPMRGELVHGTVRSLWANSPFALAVHDMGGEALLVPADREAYLAENYGDFRTEQPIFESSVDCPNVRNCLSWSALMFLLRKHRQFHARQDAPRLDLLTRRISAFKAACLFNH